MFLLSKLKSFSQILCFSILPDGNGEKFIYFVNVSEYTFMKVNNLNVKCLKIDVLFSAPMRIHCLSAAGIYMFKINNRNIRARCEICSKLTIKTPELNFKQVNAGWEHFEIFRDL